MKNLLTLPLIIITILIFTLYAKDKNFISYSYYENFEQNISYPLKYWVTNLSKKDRVNISYNLDKNSYTQGSSSLKIDIDVISKSKKSWYYYIQIPLNSTPNLKGDLSFSVDIKTDQKSSKNIQIGFNLEYFPYTSGIQPIQKSIEPNVWNKIEVNDLKSFSINHAKNFLSKMYDTNLTTFGRAISKIVILIKGNASQKYSINLDNLKLKGNIEKKELFIKNYQKSWHEYIEKVNRDIRKRGERYKKLLNIGDIQLCPSKKYYSSKIYTLLKDINITLKKSKILKPSTIDILDSYLRKLKSLNSKSLSKINLYKMSAMQYYNFNSTTRQQLNRLKSYNLRMTRGEYKSIAILIESICSSKILSIENSNFIGNKSEFSKDNLDLYIAKRWYQSGLNNTLKTGKYLTPELLLKDESLVKVDYKTKTNYLKVKYDLNNSVEYIKISNPTDKFPKTNTISFNDSKFLQPFGLNSLKDKIIWGIIHIPKDIKDGNYTTTVKIVNQYKKVLRKFPINIEVLPFKLDKSKLLYSLYYTGKLSDNEIYPMDSYNKTKKQQLIELKDIKSHGVLYPTSYENLNNLEDTLKIREEVGLPHDRFFTVGFNVMSSNLSYKIKEYKKLLEKYGYKHNSLYIYGIDEASPNGLKKERNNIQKAHSYGAKVFTAGYEYTYKYLKGYLDLFNYANAIYKKNAYIEVGRWHGISKEIFAYASPQCGVENPEIYRRNFGCKLWKKGFDGAMNWAYQAKRGALWNDFDKGDSRLTKYRDELFTYPTTDGIIGTIQWEGFREAITDVRYISTLENLRNMLEVAGKDVYYLNLFIKNIDCDSNLDKLREKIIDNILRYRNVI